MKAYGCLNYERNMWSRMKNNEFNTDDTLLNLLRLLRLFGAAPVRINTTGRRARISVSYKWAIYGYFVTTFANVLLGIYIYKMKNKMKTLLMTVWLVNLSLLMCRVSTGSYTSVRRIRNLLQVLKDINKVFNDFDHTYKFEKGRDVKMYLIRIFVALAIANLLLGFFKKFTTFLEGIQYVAYTLLLLIENIIFILLDLQMTVVNMKIGDAFITLNRHLKTLLGPKDATLHLNYNNDVRRICKSYLSLCGVVSQINQLYGVTLFLMFSSTVIFLALAGYIFADIIASEGDPRCLYNLARVAALCFVCIYRTVYFIISCHQISKEAEEMNIILCKLIYQETEVGGEIPWQMEVALKQLTMTSPTYSPLGMFTVRNSILTAILSIWITYAVILIQIRVGETSGVVILNKTTS